MMDPQKNDRSTYNRSAETQGANKSIRVKIVEFIIGFLLGALLWGILVKYPRENIIYIYLMVITFILILANRLKRKYVTIGMSVAALIPIVFYALIFGACAIGLITTWH